MQVCSVRQPVPQVLTNGGCPALRGDYLTAGSISLSGECLGGDREDHGAGIDFGAPEYLCNSRGQTRPYRESIDPIDGRPDPSGQPLRWSPYKFCIVILILGIAAQAFPAEFRRGQIIEIVIGRLVTPIRAVGLHGIASPWVDLRKGFREINHLGSPPQASVMRGTYHLLSRCAPPPTADSPRNSASARVQDGYRGPSAPAQALSAYQGPG